MKKLILYLLLLVSLTIKIFGQSAIDEKVHIVLEPNQKKDPIKIETSCFILLRDYPISISIPFGNTYKTLLPKGTKYLVEKGTYPLENPAQVILEFELVSTDKCRE